MNQTLEELQLEFLEEHQKWISDRKRLLRKQEPTEITIPPSVVSPPRKAKIRRQSDKKFPHHGLDREQRLALLSNHHSGCEICGDEVLSARFHVDHCHDTGKIRGILCNGCNSGLGFFRENIERMEKGIQYLRIHKEQ